MDNQEHEYFLLGIADKVEELVAVLENRKRFEHHSCDLGKTQAVYSRAIAQADKQWQTYLAKPLKPLPDRISYLKSKGWEQVDLEADSTPVNTRPSFEHDGWHCWKLPKMPTEPLFTFLSVLAGEVPEAPLPRIDKALAYYYFSLATIHDKMRKGDYISIHNDTYAKQLAKSVWPTIENLCVDKQHIINNAFNCVKEDLTAKTPAKTEQNTKLVKEAGKKTNNKILRPTVDEIAEIIGKLRTLKEKESAFVNEKHKDISVDESAQAIAALPIDKSIDPENYTEKLSVEQLLKLLIGCDSSIPTDIKQRTQGNEKILKFIGMHPQQLFEKKLRQSSIIELQRLQNEVIPKLLAGSEVLSTQKQHLYEVKNSVSRELKQKNDSAKSIPKLMENIKQIDVSRMKPKGFWPEDIQSSINNTVTLLFPYGDYLTAKGSWGEKELALIEHFIKAGIPPYLDEVIHELEKIEHKMEVEARQPPEKPAETEQDGRHVKKPKAESWKQITIEVVDDDTIKYKVKDGKWKRANYTELDFLDKRKNQANTLWSIFLGLARKNIPHNIDRPKIKPKQIDRIRDTLRWFFGIDELPIKYDKRAKEYHCEFMFNDPRDWMSILQNENLAD